MYGYGEMGSGRTNAQAFRFQMAGAVQIYVFTEVDSGRTNAQAFQL